MRNLVAVWFLLISIVSFDRGSDVVLAQQTAPPNVVIVITDDQGYGDLSCLGNPVLKTPHLDDLHRQSFRLTNYHVSPTCSPTRAALQTGHWTNRTGVWHTIMGRSMLRENEITIGQMFHDAGYATGMFGKWHLGDNYPFRPEDRGYTEVLRHGGGGVGQTPDYWDNAYFDGSYWHNGEPVPVQGFCTDVFFDYAQQFIKDQHQAGKPFLAYISTNAPHGPMHSPEKYSEPYSDQPKNVANFLGMIANIDDNVGQLRAFLQEQGLAENTIFIFTTDNGTSSGAKIFNAGMRGQKGSEYDGGHRVPFFVHWPQGNLTGGRDVHPITAHVDILPTLLDLCHVQPHPDVRFDGASLAPLLRKEKEVEWPKRILVTDSQRVKDPIKWRKSAVMTDRWRLVNGKQLFDMQNDPGQKQDVAAQHPQVVKRLTDFYDNWWDELEPTFSQSTQIYLGHPAENPARLTSHDWITTGTTPWNQAHVRRALNGPANTGFWNVNVDKAGRYSFELRRWPREVDRAIDAPLPAGAAVPGAKAFRETPGKSIQAVKARVQIGQLTREVDVPAGAKQVTLEMDLPAGPQQLSATFLDAAGEEYGAYFVYVERQP
ncbi:MAG: arylsulfatase [Mariniblastus sp.]|nr:arylsulfatase [Mariniblastus sp.]